MWGMTEETTYGVLEMLVAMLGFGEVTFTPLRRYVYPSAYLSCSLSNFFPWWWLSYPIYNVSKDFYEQSNGNISIYCLLRKKWLSLSYYLIIISKASSCTWITTCILRKCKERRKEFRCHFFMRKFVVCISKDGFLTLFASPFEEMCLNEIRKHFRVKVFGRSSGESEDCKNIYTGWDVVKLRALFLG